ncbi:hypothetical protein HYX08_00335 [Candidatus Woesearchaeota archaeon]|nr:hypothetical protein [Candidatus Woesearchaeota archaeon]
MKNIHISFLALGLLVFSACVQNNQQDKISTIEKDKEISQLQNQTVVNEDEITLLPNCEPNKPYLNKDECKCGYSWKIYLREHGHCTPIKNTFYSCINGVEVEVHFESTSTFEEAEIIVNKYDGKVMQFTCWFERRDDPYITTIVKEGNEQEFIKQIQKESIVKSAHKPIFATTQGNQIQPEKLSNETKKIEILNISKEALSLKIQELHEEGDVLHYLPKVGIGPDIIEEKIILLDNKWHVDFTIKYNFGCCRGCSPEAICPAVCVFCGNKTKEIYYKIKNDGTIEEEIVTEKTCIGNSGAWFRNITGDELCSIDWNNLN